MVQRDTCILGWFSFNMARPVAVIRERHRISMIVKALCSQTRVRIMQEQCSLHPQLSQDQQEMQV
eukprot:364100-Chlamydomonas_euryale.AAC.35